MFRGTHTVRRVTGGKGRLRLLTLLFLPSLILLGGGAVSPAVGATDHIREMAKSKARIFVVTSGAEAEETGKRLQATIMRHKENKHKAADVAVLSLKQAESAAATDPKFGQTSVIFILAGKDQAGPLPDSLSRAMILSREEMATSGGVLQSVYAQPPDKGMVFTVVMAAPDAERLTRLENVFVQHTAPKYNTLPMSKKFSANKVAVFSAPEDRTFLEDWGEYGQPDVWDYVDWRPIADREKLSAEELSEYSEVYFVNRKQGASPLPGTVTEILNGNKIRETTTLVASTKDQAGRAITLVSAPTNLILQKKAARYPTLSALARAPLAEEVVDLRKIGRTTLRVNGGDRLSESEKDQIRLQLARDMRQNLRMDVEERGNPIKELQAEITVQNLLGAPDTARLLRAKTKMRYIWLYHITDYSGSTNYTTEERSLTPDPGAFSQYEPTEPSSRKGPFGGKKSPERLQSERVQYRIDHAKWEREKRAYEQEYEDYPCQWERSVTKQVSARVRGMLQLVDLADKESLVKVLWEKECSFDVNDSQEHQSDRVTVRGHKNHPGSMDAPPSSNECPAELLRTAAYRAGASGLNYLQEEAWLPDGSPSPDPTPPTPDPDPTPEPDPDPTPRPPAPSNLPKVASVKGQTVTLNIGSGRGVRVGDRVDIALETREIKDPDSGRVLRTDTVRSIILRVRRVDALTADCTPVNEAEAQEIRDVKEGMAAKWRRSQAPTRITDTPLKGSRSKTRSRKARH